MTQSVFPKPSRNGDWRQWTKRLSEYLLYTIGRLRFKTGDESAAEDGIILWDRSINAPVVSEDGKYLSLMYGQSKIVTIAELPTASDYAGYRMIVNDSSVTTFLSTVIAGGANIVPVFSDGTNWKVG